MEPQQQLPPGVDSQAIQEALQKHIAGGAPTPQPVPSMPPPASAKSSQGSGFDDSTKAIAKALIQKLLSVV